MTEQLHESKKDFPHNFTWSEEKWFRAIIMNINSGSLHSASSSLDIASNQIRIYDSIKHELSEWLRNFFHYLRFILTIAVRTFVGMRIGNLIFSRRAIWIAAVERPRNDPYRRTNATTTRTARNPISFCQKKCSASSKIIYPAWMSWICSFWFSSTTRAERAASIILIYFTHPDISFCLPFGFDIPIKIRHFHPSRLLSLRSVTSCSRKMRIERSGMRENNLENDHHMVSSMLFRDNFLPSSSLGEKIRSTLLVGRNYFKKLEFYLIKILNR